jgi:hypothetical protein
MLTATPETMPVKITVAVLANHTLRRFQKDLLELVCRRELAGVGRFGFFLACGVLLFILVGSPEMT